MEPTPLEQAIAEKAAGAGKKVASCTFERDDLLTALSRVIGALDRTGPVTSHVMISASDGQALVRAMSSDMQATAKLPCRGEITTTAPGEQLRAALQTLSPGSQLQLELAERLNVKSGRSRWKLPVVAPDLFAEWPAVEGVSFTLRASELASDLSRVAFAAAKDDSKGPQVRGVFVHGDGALRFAATNAQRISAVTTEIPADYKGCSLAPKFVAECIRVLDGAGDCTLTLSSSRSVLEFGALKLTSKVLDGTYPPYQRFLPEHTESVTFGREAMIAALKRLQVVGEGRRGLVAQVTGDTMSLTSRSMDAAECHDEIGCERVGGDFRFEISGVYLAEAMAQLTGEKVTLQTGTERQPMLMVEGDLSLLIVPQFTGAAD